LLAVGSDQPVHTATVVSQRLGLPTPLSTEQALAVTNKAVMKGALREAGIPTVPWTLLGGEPSRWEEEGLGSLNPPWVVKPLDSQGQRGIVIVRTREELRNQFPVTLSFSRESRILVEEYYPSREVTVSGWARGATLDPTIWTITDRVTFDPSRSPGVCLGVCLAHRFPSEAAHGRHQEIEEITARIARALALRDVPIYFQMLIGAKGVLVNEIACRLGGAYEDVSIPLVTGVDILSRQLRAFLPGEFRDALTPEGPATPPRARYFAVPLIFARSGVVHRLIGDTELRTLPGVAECRFLLPEGTQIREMSNSTQRIAYAVLHGPDRQSINKLVHTAFDTLRVEDAAGKNLLIDSREETLLPFGV